MTKTILLTSFTTWEAHQRSNASDDLLELISQDETGFHYLRKLPVDFKLAPEKTIAHIQQLQPDAIVLCGMAESRMKLSVESRAALNETVLFTSLNVEKLIENLAFTEVSHDAGRFVCNALYFATLNYLREQKSHAVCLFVHVPVLTSENLAFVATDFRQILERIRTL